MVTGAEIRERIQRTAHERFGFERLRPGQEAAVEAVLAEHDTLAVLPTGSGKSAIYQLAAVLLAGPTVVVSPLIALQRDQMAMVAEHPLGRAAQISSAVSAADRRDAFEALARGELEFLFLAPEQFNNPEVLDRLTAARPSLFVVDEAHCVSEWGHDFRPEYLRIGTVIEALGHPRVLALTATASPPVRQEIITRLRMRAPRVVARGFDRPNIWLGVVRHDDESAKLRALAQAVMEAEKPGIVYAATRRRAEEVAEALRRRGVHAEHYHAGMRVSERTRIQTAFMQDALEVIVATIAFGMGVDKSNVRFVFHYDISDSLDSYYQEIGRAGRDGQPARALLFYRPEDVGLRRFFASGGQVDADEVAGVAEILRGCDTPVDPERLREETGLSETKLMAALTRLEEAGAIELLATGEVARGAALAHMEDFGTLAEAAADAQERYLRVERSRVEMMQGYAEVHDCRREYLLNYFGEEHAVPCGYCDNCEAGLTIPRDEAAEPFPINSRVVHKSLGPGMVVRYEGNKMVVLFEQVGYRTLAVDLVTTGGLLQPAP